MTRIRTIVTAVTLMLAPVVSADDVVPTGQQQETALPGMTVQQDEAAGSMLDQALAVMQAQEAGMQPPAPQMPAAAPAVPPASEEAQEANPEPPPTPQPTPPGSTPTPPPTTPKVSDEEIRGKLEEIGDWIARVIVRQGFMTATLRIDKNGIAHLEIFMTGD